MSDTTIEKSVNHTTWKVSKYGVSSSLYFPVFSPNEGKYGPEKNPYLDTFHAVLRIRKEVYFSRWSSNLLFTKILLTTERRQIEGQFSTVDLSPTLLNAGTKVETLQQSGKQDFFRAILKSSTKFRPTVLQNHQWVLMSQNWLRTF